MACKLCSLRLKPVALSSSPLHNALHAPTARCSSLSLAITHRLLSLKLPPLLPLLLTTILLLIITTSINISILINITALLHKLVLPMLRIGVRIRFRIINKAARNNVLALLLARMLIAIGLLSLLLMPVMLRNDELSITVVAIRTRSSLDEF